MDLFYGNCFKVTFGKIFRNADGHATADPASGLDLRLEDFTNQQVLAQYPNAVHGRISIPATDLCAYLNAAEEAWSIVKNNRGSVMPMPPGVKKRSRDESPPDELLPSREMQFQDDEHRAHKQVNALDLSFETSTASSEDGEN